MNKIHKCANHGRRVCFWCILQSAAFPIEHFIWEKAPLLRNLTHALGL